MKLSKLFSLPSPLFLTPLTHPHSFPVNLTPSRFDCYHKAIIIIIFVFQISGCQTAP